jgi:nitroreductase
MTIVKRVARLLLPANVRSSIWRARWTFDHDVRRRKLAFATQSPSTASFYFGFMNDALSREAHAVASGQRRYLADRQANRANLYQLRRNVHRLEKGLVMRPRRSIFARDFINETVKAFAAALDADPNDTVGELKWARDVLTQYFAVVDCSDPTIARAWAAFQAIPTQAGEAPAVTSDLMAPYARRLSPSTDIDFDAFMQLCRRRRSVRWYRGDPLPREIVDKALTAAAQSPSACNRQPFVYRIFDNPEQAREIARLAGGTKGFVDQIPAVAVLVGQLRAYPFERDRHAIYIDAALSAMSFMMALETLGAASCPINWPDQEPQESQMRERLQLEPDERVVMLISFGWPDPEGMVPFSAKRDVEMIRSYNR